MQICKNRGDSPPGSFPEATGVIGCIELLRYLPGLQRLLAAVHLSRQRKRGRENIE